MDYRGFELCASCFVLMLSVFMCEVSTWWAS